MMAGISLELSPLTKRITHPKNTLKSLLFGQIGEFLSNS